MRPASVRRVVSIPPLSSRTITTASIRFAAAATAPAPRAPPRTYTKKVATPAVTRTAAPRAGPVRAAPKPSLPVEDFDDFSGVEDHDHSIPDLEAGIDDYAALAPPPTVVRRARTSAPVQEQPTPSPPLSALPVGTSTLPIITTRQPDIMGEQSTGLAVGEAGELDWSTSFAGLGQRPFPKEVGEALLRPLEPADVEVKPGPSVLYVLRSIMLMNRWALVFTRNQV